MTADRARRWNPHLNGSMTEHYRARFPRGCRVTLDVATLAAAHLNVVPPYTGTVTGYARYFAALWIQLDDRKRPQKFRVRYVRRLEDRPPHARCTRAPAAEADAVALVAR